MITKEEILKLALLSRIDISENEAESLTSQIDSILGYVGHIKELTGNVNDEIPTLRNVMREDVVTNSPSEFTEIILNEAPAREGNYLKVKKILE
ncbi:Asp-tRNA(Asn)/Glu-tRNA(Gln) amidotransferase subunit GatC [Patescibacteria group bacterium]|nr:Asp-tRNA(Asn)/Glu-tRNA(Gln) amidotransferase subunit GatC [Patescibacteria group bacterium]